MTPEQEHSITAKDRNLAHVALASVAESAGPCPEVAEIALLVDGRLEKTRQEAVWNHLAACATCYASWRDVAEEQQNRVKPKRLAKIIALGGGLLAAAASVMLFVNVQYAPIPEVTEMTQAPEPTLPGKLVSETASPATSTAEQSETVQAEDEIKRLKKRSKSRLRQREPSPAPLLHPPPSEDDHFAALDPEKITGDTVLDIGRVIPTVLQKLKQLQPGEIIAVRTYKRDRGFSVALRANNQVLVREFGFNEQELTVPVTKLKKILKTIVKTEFPHSNKAWLKVTVAPPKQ